MASAEPGLRKWFRAPNFGPHVAAPLSARGPRAGLMTEDEARAEENENTSPDELVAQCGAEKAALLDLSHFKLRAVPQRLASLTHLATLDLRHNALTSLPEAVGSLTGLRRVNLSVNRLESLPASIVGWGAVTDLDLSSNLLRELPEEIGFLDSLTRLNLDYNYFTKIPEAIGELDSLENLFIVENSAVTALPPARWFARFRKLEMVLDNSPALSREWGSIERSVAGVSVRWNKIWPDFVTEGIYLGSLRTAQNEQVFSSLKMTHVLTCGRNMQTNIPESLQRLRIEVDDTEAESLDVHFDRACAFIDSAVRSGGNVLIHCFAGVSRSAAVCVAYLIKEHQMTCADAMRFVKQRRPAINPNPAFRAQLDSYERALQRTRSG